MTTFLGAPVLVRGEAWGNIYLTEKEGGEFDEADEQALLVLARWVAIAIENAHLYEDIDARRGELERAVSGLEATVAITRAVGGETDLEPRARAGRQARPRTGGRPSLPRSARGGRRAGGGRGRGRDRRRGGRHPLRRPADRPRGDVLRSGHAERLSRAVEPRAARPRASWRTDASIAMLVPLTLPRPRHRRPRRARPLRLVGAVQRRGRAADARLRRQRRDRSGDRADRRGGAAADEHRVRRPGARPLGPRASRRDAPGARRTPGDAHHGPQARQSRRRSEARPSRRSARSRPRSPSFRA